MEDPQVIVAWQSLRKRLRFFAATSHLLVGVIAVVGIFVSLQSDKDIAIIMVTTVFAAFVTATVGAISDYASIQLACKIYPNEKKYD